MSVHSCACLSPLFYAVCKTAPKGNVRELKIKTKRANAPELLRCTYIS
jgi:hypothetical protein